MYKSIQPPSHLKKYIRIFWEGQIEVASKQAFTNVATASTRPVWLFYLKGEFKSGNNLLKDTSMFYGQTDKHADYSFFEKSQIFGVEFYPYALPHLFSIPTSELTNSILDVKNLLGNYGKDIEEKVLSVNTLEERVALLSKHFESRLASINERDKSIIAAIELVNQLNSSVNIDFLVKQSYSSQRHFERKFKELSGFSPISYTKIARFLRALNYLLYSKEPLTNIALSFGYYDQAHFNNDFKKFTGYNPKEYLRINKMLVY